MKPNPKPAAALALALLLLAPSSALAHRQKQKKGGQKPAPAQPTRQAGAGERPEPDDAARQPSDVSEEVLANRSEQSSEEADAAIPDYNDFLTSYRLGPEDVISIKVFGGAYLEKYSMTGVTVPPDGRIDYYLIPEGVHVAGKTTRQVAAEITKYLDEYINEPKVTVTLDKAMSKRFGVLGDVAKPGIMVMTRRLSVYEALGEAGGILPTGKKQVFVLHWNADRTMQRIPIDVAAIEKGRAPDNYFLRPGDQIFVPGNKWKTVDAIIKAAPILSFARIFTGGW